MWFRVALLLVLWLLVFKFLNGLFRAIGSNRKAGTPGAPGGPKPRPQSASQSEPRRPWSSSDVIDVPYEEVGDEDPSGPSAGDKRRSS